ncbi:TadE/TadG family type IV pilus assembly protein [Afifella pfennigii]|uniref:TadE/TadG family type IV pilus assembly protein n=1 Tax=Afifella pfennigii TaxID=209897 RepID=UPI00146F9974|nr:TadE/TadG family type IV pilus assembly protein [Afifella pfennigii]
MKRLVRRYLRSEDGALLPLIGLASVALIGTVGLAIDIGRAQLVHAKLLNAADAGGLAAGAKLNSSSVQDDVDTYVRANFPTGYASSQVTSVTATVNASETTINVSAVAQMPTTFMQLFGIDTLDVRATSEITRETGGLEVVMVLDNTGSMRGYKLTALKSAANELVDILFGDDSPDHLYMGLVPFAQTVNIGSGKKSWLNVDVTDQSAIDYAQSEGYEWNGCVEARTLSGRDVTDDPPSTESFSPFYWRDPDDLSSGYSDQSYNNWASTEATGHYERQCTLYFWGRCWRYENVWVEDGEERTYNTPFSDTFGPNKSCLQAVTPLTASKSAISNAIDAMKVESDWYTHIPMGAVWGWRMLSPNWRGLWGGEMDTNNLPLDYNNDLMDKAAIIMTDGDNTMPGRMADDVWTYTAYGTLPEGRLGTTNGNAAEGEMDDRLEEVCTSMKNVGIIVYTIAFGNPGNSTKAMMRRCASQNDFFFDSPSSADLSEAFREIGDSLSNLRVSR